MPFCDDRPKRRLVGEQAGVFDRLAAVRAALVERAAG